jgi:hypothetical protein
MMGIAARKQDQIAFTLSIVIHILLILYFYYFVYNPQPNPVSSTRSYKIALAAPHRQEQVHSTSPNKQIAPTQAPSPPEAIPVEATTGRRPSLVDNSNEAVPVSQEAAPAVDTRALYPSTQPPSSSGASLELPGWMWDTFPSLQDQTDEIGKLVFEITIDDMGEIIAIKTLEKTVNPVVEQFYKDEVAKLTFTKTSQHATYQPTTTGKITFILQYKP